ncbi:MAG: hypothetical protein ACMUIP_03285 [bacterium]
MRSYFLISFFCFLLVPKPLWSSSTKRYKQLTGVIDVRTTYSDGDFNAYELVDIARSAEIDVLVITDHDLMRIQYGLFPFRNILRLRIDRPSVLKKGAEQYFAMLHALDRQTDDVIIVPGVETAPFYYWSGWPLPGKLTLHEWEKHLLVLGVEDPEKIKSLPVLHGTPGFKYVKKRLPESILFSLPFFACLWLIIYEKKRKWWSFTTLGLTFLLLLNYLPFSASPFDPYHGNQGMKPYQELIDYVNSCGGMSFWTHPETTSGIRDLGTIKVSTLPHGEDLLRSIDYAGFATLYGDRIKAPDPGREWDITLKEYCLGIRERPPWGISSSDYHNEHPAPFGTYITTFLAETKNKNGVLNAIEAGRMYNYMGPKNGRIFLDCFEIEDTITDGKAIMGETITIPHYPLIIIRAMRENVKSPSDLHLKIIRSGIPCYEEKGKKILNVSWIDHDIEPGHMYYYRIEIRGEGRMLSNPIFVRTTQRRLQNALR